MIRVTVILLLCLASSPLVQEGKGEGPVQGQRNWPIFRGGPEQIGVAAGTLPDKLEVLWRFQAKDGFESAVAIADSVVYAGCYDGHLYALDLKTGQVKWKYKAGPIKAPPGYHRNVVYVGDEEGVFHAVDAATGKKRWTFETRGEITAGANFAGDSVLIGSYDSTLYCLSTEGKLQWKVKTEGPVNGSPTVAGKFTFVAGCDSQLRVIDLDKGIEVRAIDLGGQAAATPAVIGDRLYVGTMSNQMLAIDWKKGKQLWSFEDEEEGQAFFASAAVTDKLVIVGSRGRRVHAFKRDDGKPAWTFPTRNKVDASPVVVGQRVYAPSNDGKLYVLELQTGKEIQKLELGRSMVASPAVAEGLLVIGTTDGLLYCLGSKQ